MPLNNHQTTNNTHVILRRPIIYSCHGFFHNIQEDVITIETAYYTGNVQTKYEGLVELDEATYYRLHPVTIYPTTPHVHRAIIYPRHTLSTVG